MDDVVWHARTFTKNCDQLVAGGASEAFFAAIVRQADTRGLLSREHFTVGGTILDAWASHKSFRLIEDGDDDDQPNMAASGNGNPRADFRGERCLNTMHRSVTDPEVQLVRKGPGKPALLVYRASVLTNNWHGLIVAAAVGLATGTAEVEQAEIMLGAMMAEPAGRTGHRTVGADKGYDEEGFVDLARRLAYAPHVAQVITAYRGSRIDGRTTHHWGYAERQRRRKRVEESSGWGKVVGLLRKLRHRAVALVDAVFTFTMAIYNLVRLWALVATRGTG